MQLNSRSAILLGLSLGTLILTSVPVALATEILSFSPEGKVRNVRQVRASFSEAMVPLGKPQAPSPFDISCKQPGTGRWIDAQNWIFDFAQDLPTKVSCDFAVKKGLRSIKGSVVTGAEKYSFATGNPVIQEIEPYEGSEITSDQAFLLIMDGQVKPQQILSSTTLVVDGIQSRIPIEMLSAKDVAVLLNDDQFKRYESIIGKSAFFIHAKQNFPAMRKVKISFQGDARKFEFEVQSDFKVEMNCERENSSAACSPISPIRVTFNAEADAKLAEQIRLKDASGKLIEPKLERGSRSDTRRYLQFAPPFQAASTYTIVLPTHFVDMVGRPAVNAKRFPLPVKTAAYPPLIKFAANFGILESADANLPVTVRAVEPELSAAINEVHVLNASANEADFFRWIQKVGDNSDRESVRNDSVFDSSEKKKLKTLKLPKVPSQRDFEVMGIPLKDPGFYVVEIESPILGASLKGKPDGKIAPFYVSTAVLVTDMSVHLKIGRERSLVWVTQLSNAKPVADAEVELRSCNGDSVFKGKTNSSGFVFIESLPKLKNSDCSSGFNWLASAKKGNDRSFVVDTWHQGIENYRFNLGAGEFGLANASNLVTVFDRTLLRAGETVHMKHVGRVPTGTGFRFLNAEEAPKFVRITHTGSDQKYYLPFKLDASGNAVGDWKIPKTAKLGTYEITFAESETEEQGYNTPVGGTFHVEEYKVPLMKASLSGPAETLISPLKIPVHAALVYLNGGSAANQPITVRYQFESDSRVSFSDYDDFSFNSKKVRERTTKRGESASDDDGEKFDTSYKTLPMNLDKAGGAEVSIVTPDGFQTSGHVNVEMEYRDPSGATGTVARHFPIWKSNRFVGIAPIPWDGDRKKVSLRTVVVDLKGKPVANAAVSVDQFKETYFSYRKKLVGGFFSYDSTRKVERIGPFCSGKTDKSGYFLCDGDPKTDGELIFQASTKDTLGNETYARADNYIYGDSQDWQPVSDNDRMDLITNAKTIEPGDKARIQLRMPFREATALVTVEREGVLDAFVTSVSGLNPEIKVPMKESYAPNAFVSVLAVRGRVSTPQPTALVDLGRPSFKMGIQKLKVGWAGHELKVKVETDKPVYQTREKAKARIKVKAPSGQRLDKTSEVAVAVIDEGLLELMPNKSWDLLNAMMHLRSFEVQTSTAQLNVIGKRHFGKKALAAGGGGGNSASRELFDTLLYWNPHVTLNSSGEANVEFPVNDSLTKFRVAVVATSGENLFGEGEASFVSTRDLQLMTGLPQLLRAGDHVTVQSVVRNTTSKDLKTSVSLQFETGNSAASSSASSGLSSGMPLAGSVIPAIPGQTKSVELKANSSVEIPWTFDVPLKIDSLRIRSEVKLTNGSKGGLNDSTLQTIPVWPAMEPHTIQATLLQVGGPGAPKNFKNGINVPVVMPANSVPGTASAGVTLSSSIAGSLEPVMEAMRRYPYNCLEQRTSRSIVLNDAKSWAQIAEELPTYLDSDGLLKYWPIMDHGSDVLTAYIMDVTQEAGFKLPETAVAKMQKGLEGFVTGKISDPYGSHLETRWSQMRKLGAIEALSRYGKEKPELLSSIQVTPKTWPTHMVLDWWSILKHWPKLPNQQKNLKEAESVLRARLDFRGTKLGFASEKGDFYSWLMSSPDESAAKLMLLSFGSANWASDLPRLVRGVLDRRELGVWYNTTANTWGTLAMRKFVATYEKTPVQGVTKVSFGTEEKSQDWLKNPKGDTLKFEINKAKQDLKLTQVGSGAPWAMLAIDAAVRLKAPVGNGIKMSRELIPVQQKAKGIWSRGDIARVHIKFESQSDYMWVVVRDPLPAGVEQVGGALANASKLLTGDEKTKGDWPSYVERAADSYRAYYQYVSKGESSLDYTIRFNQSGLFKMPNSHMEVMYSPGVHADAPNADLEIKE